MARNVRNFWIELEVDGKKTKVATGPRSKGGGFQLTVKMRDQGEIITALVADGDASTDGELVLHAIVNNDYLDPEASNILTLKTIR